MSLNHLIYPFHSKFFYINLSITHTLQNMFTAIKSLTMSEKSTFFCQAPLLVNVRSQIFRNNYFVN